MPSHNYETVNPHPSYLIKSISEQGYRLETSLADLIDNSVAAGADAIEVLVSASEEPFTLFLADNGSGMTEKVLRESMRFPSASPDHSRKDSDLGRFGLGMKLHHSLRRAVLQSFRGQRGPPYLVDERGMFVS